MPHPKAVVLGSYLPSLINFRKQLLIDLRDKGYEVIAMTPGKDHDTEEELRSLRVKFISVPLSRTGFNPLADIRSFFFLKKLFDSIKPALLVTYTIKPNIYGTWACNGIDAKKLAWITGLGYIGLPALGLKDKLVKGLILRLYRRAFKKLEYIAFQNPDDKQFFEKNNLLCYKTRQTITAGSGVDLSRFTRSKPVTSTIHFLLIARLINAKGVNEYLAAAEKLKAIYQDKVFFNLIGMLDVNNPDSIHGNRVNQLHGQGVIEYHGEQKDIRPFLSASSVFVLPSYYREGTPRTILEAMAMGKPIITTENPGCKETVVEGQNGFLIPTKNIDALADAMDFFIQNPKKIIEMGENSYNMAVHKYDVHKVNHQLLSFIEA